jgi:hypothetical protein
MEDQVPVFMSPSDNVARLYLQAPGSHFVAFYGFLGYGGVSLTRLHTGVHSTFQSKNIIRYLTLSLLWPRYAFLIYWLSL